MFIRDVIVDEMNARWDHFDAFEIGTSPPAIVIYTEFNIPWDIKKQEDSTIIEESLGCILVH